jgi:hypothetical protein
MKNESKITNLKNTEDLKGTQTDMEIRIKEALEKKALSEQARTKKPNTKSMEKQLKEKERKEQEVKELLELPKKIRRAPRKIIEEYKENKKNIQKRVDKAKEDQEEFKKNRKTKNYFLTPEDKVMGKMLPVIYQENHQFMRENGLTKEDLETPWFQNYLNYLNSGHPAILNKKNEKGENIFNEEYFLNEWPKTIYSIEDSMSRRDFIKLFKEGIFNYIEKTLNEKEINANPKIKKAYEKGKQRAIQTIKGLKIAEKWTKENIESGNEFGKFIYHNYAKYENDDKKQTVNQIPRNLSIMGLKALGYDTLMEFNPKNKNFFLFSNSERIVNGAKIDLEKEYNFNNLEIFPNSLQYQAREDEELVESQFLKNLHLNTKKENTENETEKTIKAETTENKTTETEEDVDFLRKNLEEKLKAKLEDSIKKNDALFEKRLEEYKEKTDKFFDSKKEEIVDTVAKKIDLKVFEELNDIQKAIVLQETNKIILDKIEAEAIKQQRENNKKGNFFKKGFQSFFSSYYLAKTKKEIGDKLLHGEEFEKIKAEVSKKIKESNVTGEVLENGKLSINLLNENVLNNPTEEEKALFKEFNHSANIIIEKSFEDERKEKNDEIWSLKNKYNLKKSEVIQTIYQNQIKNGLTETEAMNYAQNIIAKIDTQVIVNRFFTQHPEAEKELEEISKEPGFFKHLGGTFVNKQKGINFAIGASIRAGTASTFGAFVAPVTGMVIGGLMGYKKSAKEMKDDDFLAKSGDIQGKKTDKNFREIIDENNPKAGLAQKLNNLIDRIEKETDSNKKAELVRMLENRVNFTMNKISKEEVSFGTGATRVQLENELANSLAKAETIKLITARELNITEEKNNEINDDFNTISDKIYFFLRKRDRIVKKNRDNKLAWDTAKGALMGAVFAEIGYQAVDYLKTNGYMPSLGLKELMPSFKIGGMFGNTETEVVAVNTNNTNPVAKTPNQEAIDNLVNKIINEDTTKKDDIANVSKIEVSASSLGAIQTINDLKNQLLSEYKGGLSKAPANIQEILTKNSMDLSKELGLFNPEDVNESVMMQKGSTMSINEKGELVLNDTKTGKSFVLIDEKGTVHKYKGEMFDSDKIKTLSNSIKEENPLKEKFPETKTTIEEENPLKEKIPTEDNNKTTQEENPLRKANPEQEKGVPLLKNEKDKLFMFPQNKEGGITPKAKFEYNTDGSLQKIETEAFIDYTDREAYLNEEKINNLNISNIEKRQLEMRLNQNLSDYKVIQQMSESPEKQILNKRIDTEQQEIIKKYGDVIKQNKLITPYIEENDIEKQDNPVVANEEKTEDPYATKIVNKKELLDNTFEKNLKSIIKNEKNSITWETIKNDSKDLTAHKIMSMEKENVPERLKPFYNYLMQIKEVSRLKPIREDEFTMKNETVEEYMKRGLEKIIKKGKLESFLESYNFSIFREKLPKIPS